MFAQIAMLIEMAGVRHMPRGWQIVIRAELCDATSGRPHGLSYALILQDETEERLLGFDNSHGFDGAGDSDPFDHEHKLGKEGQCFRYCFTSPMSLLADFFERVEAACAVRGVPFECEDDE